MKITIDTDKKVIEYVGNLGELFDYLEKNVFEWSKYSIVCREAERGFMDRLLGTPTQPIWIGPPTFYPTQGWPPSTTPAYPLEWVTTSDNASND